MIRYPTSRAELEARAEDPAQGGKAGWLARADALRQKNEAAGRFVTAKQTIWGEVKDVFGRLQHFKCAYCERELPHARPGAPRSPGSVERDVEHFRPKSSVKAWKVPKALAADGIAPQTGAASNGYYKLAYELENYAIACKTCNSSLKGDRFPIGGARDPDGGSPAALNRAEKPYLIFPIGTIDDDPEMLIGFVGATPVARRRKGSHGYLRARVTIEFFGLADADARSELFTERARVICAVYLAWMLVQGGGQTGDPVFAQRTLDDVQNAAQPHASCARSFAALCQRDPARAQVIANEAQALLASKSPF